MSPVSIAIVLLLEGLASAGLQMLIIRQVQGYVGSSVLVTSIVISTFLAALALGYFSGGRTKSSEYRGVLIRNLVISIGLFGVGLSYPFVNLFFSSMDSLTGSVPMLNHVLFHLFVYSSLVMMPLVYVLGQTVPLMLHTSKSETSKSEAAGNLTALSTVGNVFGATFTALILLTIWGVGTSIMVNGLILFVALLLLVDFKNRKHLAGVGVASSFLLVSLFLNVIMERAVFDATTPYGNIKVVEHENGRAMLVNNQFASYFDEDGQAWPYIETMRNALKGMDSNKDVLVLGAGGYTLSAAQTELKKHDFTYVDIDSKLKSIAETKLLRDASVYGQSIPEDARSFLLTREKSYDVIVVDLFTSSLMIPAHTATLEFFKLVKSRLNGDGVAMLNIAANPYLNDEYSQRIDRTVRAAFGRCVTSISGFRDGLESLVYFCQGGVSHDQSVYTDDKESVSIDAFLLAKQKKDVSNEQ